MELFLSILGLSILILIVFLLMKEVKILTRIVKLKRHENEFKISDERYYELYYKIQLIITVTSIIVLVGGFVGYNSIHSIKEDISKDMEHYKTNLRKSDSTLTATESVIQSLDSNRIVIQDELHASQEALHTSLNETNRIKLELLKLQKEFAPNIQTYIIKNIPYVSSPDKKTKIYYKDLKTADGNQLPKFNEPPIINLMSVGMSGITIVENTNEYFEYYTTSFLVLEGPDIKPSTKFDIMITKYK